MKQTSDWESLEDFRKSCTELPVPCLIDEIAARRPDRPFVSLPRTEHVEDGFQDYTYKDLATAVDRCAWWIVDLLGKSENFETLAYVGPQDLRYVILLLGAAKTGHKMQSFHPATSLEYHLSLLRATNCKILLHSTPVLPIVDGITSAYPMEQIIAVPELSSWLNDTSTPAFPYAKTLTEVYNHPLAVVHSSGTTGPPKPIVWTHGPYVSQYASQCSVPTTEHAHLTHAQFHDQRTLITAPISIAAGMYYALGHNLLWDFPIVLPPPWTSRITAPVLDSLHQHANVTVSITPPRWFKELSQSPTYLANLRRLKYLAYIGAPVPPEIGRKLGANTRVASLYGSTECGLFPLTLSAPEDPEYMTISHSLPFEMRHVCQDIHELVLLRQPGSEEKHTFQGVYSLFPDAMEYRMSDLFSRHPDPKKAETWSYRGRYDDLLDTSTGEKFLPKSMELIIEAHPAVEAALICDRGPEGLALLVGPSTSSPGLEKDVVTESQKQQLLDEIWPTVQEANEICPVSVKIMRELMQCTLPGKPMLIGPKGYPQRAATVDLYGEEIEALYRKQRVKERDEADADVGGGIPTPPGSTGLSDHGEMKRKRKRQPKVSQTQEATGKTTKRLRMSPRNKRTAH